MEHGVGDKIMKKMTAREVGGQYQYVAAYIEMNIFYFNADNSTEFESW